MAVQHIHTDTGIWCRLGVDWPGSAPGGVCLQESSVGQGCLLDVCSIGNPFPPAVQEGGLIGSHSRGRACISSICCEQERDGDAKLLSEGFPLLMCDGIPHKGASTKPWFLASPLGIYTWHSRSHPFYLLALHQLSNRSLFTIASIYSPKE